jgi:hypothetical protein
MSCFVVSDYHVSALVNWGARAGAIPGISPDTLAHELASANRRAFSERYAGRYDSELVPFGGLDRSAGVDLAPVAIVKACDCLDYQASDWSTWDDSEPAAHLAAIRAAAFARCNGGQYLPGQDAYSLPGYSAAPWCLDEPEPEPVDLVADRLAAALVDLSEPELAAIRSALVAVAADRRAAELARGAA